MIGVSLKFWVCTDLGSLILQEWKIEDKGENVEFIAVKVPPPPFPDAAAIRKAQPAGFSVVPNEDCPHFQSQIVMGLSNQIAQAYRANECQSCHDKSENWLCLTCGKTFCSRYATSQKMFFFFNNWLIVL